jgi:DNA-directed RNA polymerase subunit beta
VRLAEQLKTGVPDRDAGVRRCARADINEMLEQAGLNGSGQSTLYDGRTGEPSTVR